MPGTAQHTEEKWLNGLHQGDTGVYKDVYYAHFKSLSAVANHIVRNTAEAEDIAQTVLLNLWNKRTELQIHSSLGGYLKQMAVREALAVKRKDSHRQELLEERPDVVRGEAFDDTSVEYNEVKREVGQAIDGLPQKTREVFKLSRQEGMTYREIADAMDISVKTVENQMGRALRHMREALKEFLSILL